MERRAELLIVLDTPETAGGGYAETFRVEWLYRSVNGFALAAPLAPAADTLAVIAPLALLGAVAAWAAQQGLECPVLPHAEALPAALRRLAEQRHTAATRNAELLRQLAELRDVHQALADSAGALAALLTDQGIALPRLGFANPPDPHTAGTRAAELEQRIGADVRTVCGIGLHLIRPHPPTAFTLTLSAADDGRPVGSWYVPAAAWPPGWTHFAFAPPAPRTAAEAVLRLHWQGPPPALSLGRVTADPARAAVLDGTPTDRALALRVFVTVPGAGFAVSHLMFPARRLDGAANGRFDLALDAGLAPEDLRHLHEQFHFRPVSVLEGQRRLLVHPLGEVPTVARLAGVCPAGTAEVLARVETAHPDAGPIEYAVHVAEPAHAQALAEPAPLTALAEKLEWTALTPGAEALLRLELTPPLTAPADLLLLTRLPPGCSASACWAHFTRITLRGRFDAG